MEDLISVIVPIYRVEEFLEQCIESLIAQTYENLDILLVNDGSDDSCPQICDKYAKLDNRIKVIHKENGGIDDARKAGIIQAKGKYIGYIDGDDWVEPDMYEKLIGYAKKYDVEVVESGVIDFWEENETRRTASFDAGCYKGEKFDVKVGKKLVYADKFFAHGISPYLWNKLFLKQTLIDFQLLPEQNYADDIMVTFPTIAKARSIYITKECFYHYRVRGNSLKRKIFKDVLEQIILGYPDWKNRFKYVPNEYNIERQLSFFTLYIMLLKCAYVFDDLNSNMYLTPFGDIQKSDRIILYGAGQCGINLENYINNVEGNNLIAWVDKNFETLRKFYNVSNPKVILDMEYDYIIISVMAENAVNSIKQDLKKIGIPQEKILWVRDEYIKEPTQLLQKVKVNGKKYF